MLRLAGFLARNGHPHQTLDPDTDSCAKTLLERFHVEPSQLPIVLCPNGQMLRNPSEVELARCIGLVRPIDPAKVYDVAIVGAGPAGLAAAVYGASEGLSVIVLDCRAFGGQAGASARIENYLGFPTGITGMALMARAFNQAQKFGAEMAIPDEVVRLQCGAAAEWRALPARPRERRARQRPRRRDRQRRPIPPPRRRRTSPSSRARASTTGPRRSRGSCAPGRRWRWSAPATPRARRPCIWRARSPRSGFSCAAPSLEASMSRYLVDRIAALPNVEVLAADARSRALEGQGGVLEAIRWRHLPSGEETRRPIRHLFLFIGADPNTAWLSQSDVALDDKGFVRTGADLGDGRRPLETSRHGVFAIGDVRAGSVKRVAAAVGEGAQVVAALHAFLADAGGDAAAIATSGGA